MNKIYIKFILLFLFIVLLLFIPQFMDAQCPMCSMAAESNMKNGGTAAKGLNKGIFFLLTMPYVFIGTIGYLWWKNQKKKKQQLENE